MTHRRPRVLQIVTSLAVGGAQRHLLELLPGLRQSAAIDLVYLRDHDLRSEFETCVDRLTHLPMAGPFGAVQLPRLSALIRRSGYGLVHTHLLRADMYGALAARAAGVHAIVSTKHNIEARLESSSARALHALATRPTRRTIAISEAVAGWANRQLGVPRDRIEVIRYGLDPAPFSGLDRGHHFEGDRLLHPPLTDRSADRPNPLSLRERVRVRAPSVIPAKAGTSLTPATSSSRGCTCAASPSRA